MRTFHLLSIKVTIFRAPFYYEKVTGKQSSLSASPVFLKFPKAYIYKKKSVPRLNRPINCASAGDGGRVHYILINHSQTYNALTWFPIGGAGVNFFEHCMNTHPGHPSKVITVNSVSMALPTLSKLKSCLFHSLWFSWNRIVNFLSASLDSLLLTSNLVKRDK